MLRPRWRKVLRDLWINKSRSLLVVISIAIGVSAFGGLFTAREATLSNLTNQFVHSNAPDVSFMLPGFDDDLVRWAERQTDVTGAQGLAVYNVEMIADGQTHNLTLYAYDDFDAIRVNRIVPEAGNYPPGVDELALERSFVSKLDIKLGSIVTIQLGSGKQRDLRVVGSVHDLNIYPGTIQSQVSGYLTLRTLHRMGLPATYNRLDVTVQRSYRDFLGFALYPDPTAIAESLRSRLSHVGVTTQGVTINHDHEHWAADTLKGLSVVFIVVGFCSLLLSGLLVINIISGLLAQQRRQIGMMKIVGATRAQIIGIYLVMVASFGIAALAIALPASLLFGYVLVNFITARTLNFDIQYYAMPPYVLALEIGAALLVPILAALMPILNGTRITAAQAISEYVVQSRNNPVDLILARIRGLPRPMLLALRNTFRQKIRLLMTMLTLTLAGAFFMGIVNVRSGLRLYIDELLQMSQYDAQIILSGAYDRRGFEQRVQQLPGVVAVEGWMNMSVVRVLPDGKREESFRLIGLPEESMFIAPPLEAGRWLDPMTNENRYDLVVTRGFFERYNARIGDTITLRHGEDEEDWRIVGMIESFKLIAIGYSYYDSVAHFARCYPLADTLLIRTERNDSASQEQVARAVINYLNLRDIYTVGYTLGGNVRREAGGAFDVVITTLMGMSVLIALVGGLGLAGTMSLNVLERTREIGVMRSVGASTNAVRGIFLFEGVMIGVFSFALSLPLVTPFSLLFGNVLGQVMTGSPFAYQPTPMGVAAWFGIVLTVSGAASLSPAQRAAQISIREALAYE